MCQREGDSWGKPINLGPTINTKENEMFPGINNDGTLYFSSEGHAGFGALDIFESKKINGNWATPVNMQRPINSSYDDFAIAFTPGSKTGFFSSNRTGGVGNDDIYVFKNIEPPLPAFISGIVKDKASMQPLAGATVFLLNPETGKVKVVKTKADGTFSALIDKPASLTIKAMMPNFIADCTPVAVPEIKPGTTTNIPRELLLDKLEIQKTFKVNNIYYDFDKSNIREDAKPELDKLVQIMKENAINVELASHTDSRGSAAYNEKLAQRRAESAVKYIVGKGIEKESLEKIKNEKNIPNIYFIDNVPKSSIFKVLNIFDFLFLSIKKKNLYRFGINPNKLFDYMNSGKPIIQAIEASNDIVSEAKCGFTIESENQQAIVDSIKKLISLPEYEIIEMGKNGKAYVAQNHDYKFIAQKFLEIIK